MTNRQYERLPAYARDHIEDLERKLLIVRSALDEARNLKESKIVVNPYSETRKSFLPDDSSVRFLMGDNDITFRHAEDRVHGRHVDVIMGRGSLVFVPIVSNHAALTFLP